MITLAGDHHVVSVLLVSKYVCRPKYTTAHVLVLVKRVSFSRTQKHF